MVMAEEVDRIAFMEQDYVPPLFIAMFKRFGKENVFHLPAKGDFEVQIPTEDGTGLLSRLFTLEEAKYLADNFVSNHDLLTGNFPSDWPRA
jgi:hypothetical protein